MKRFSFRSFLPLIVIWLSGAGVCLAAPPSPRDELLRLVPEDVTFAFLVQNLGEKSNALKNSPFFKQLETAPLGKMLAAATDPEATKAVEAFFRDFEITPEQLVLDLLGDAFVYAYREGAKGKPNEQQGLILLAARDEKLLARLMSRIDEYQKKTGDLKETIATEYGKTTYLRRVKANAKDGDEFYLLNGKTLVFATDESLLKQAIDRGNTAAPVEKELPYLTRQLQSLHANKALFVWWVNPRSFDSEMKKLADNANGIEKSILTNFGQWWTAFEGIAFHFDLEKNLELGVSVKVRKEKLPKAVQPYFGEMAKPSQLWQVIPEDALLALATRIEGTSFVDVVGGFLEGDGKGQLQSALGELFRVFRPEQIKSLHKGLGPDLGFWVFQPDADARKKAWFPQMILAVKVQPGADGTRAAETLQTGCTLLTSFLRLINGGIAIETVRDGNSEITYVVHDRSFPNGFRPAFATKGGYFLVSASPDSIRKFEPPKGEDSKEQPETPLLRISLSGWKKYLTDQRDPLALFLSQGNDEAAKDLKKQFDQLMENLELFDRFELVQRSKGDTIGLLVRLKPAKPLMQK